MPRKPYIFFDDDTHQRDPGWALWFYDEDGEPIQLDLEETRRNAHKKALREAAEYLGVPMTKIEVRR